MYFQFQENLLYRNYKGRDLLFLKIKVLHPENTTLHVFYTDNLAMTKTAIYKMTELLKLLFMIINIDQDDKTRTLYTYMYVHSDL